MPILPRMCPPRPVQVLSLIALVAVGGCGIIRRADNLQKSIDRMDRTMSTELPKSNANAEGMRADMKETSAAMLKNLEGMRIDIKDMSAELKKSLASMQKDMGELRVSMTGEMGAMRTEMQGMRGELQTMTKDMATRLDSTVKSITAMSADFGAKFDALHSTVKDTEEGTLPRLQKIVENTNWMPAMAERTEDMKNRLVSMEGAMKSMESKTSELTDRVETGLKTVLPAAGVVGAALVIGGFLAGRRRAG